MKKIFIILGIVIFSTATVAKQSYEIGLGSSYGGFGVAFNSELSSKTELFTGVGWDLEDVGYVVGAKFWLNDKMALIADYGSNCVVIRGGYGYAYEGFNFGMRYSFTGQGEGWQFDVLVADISECNENESSITDDAAIDIAIGYRF